MNPTRAALVASALALSACVSAPKLSEDPQAIANREAREAALANVTGWSLSGRAALSDGDDGGSGSVRWRQRQSDTELIFAAPLGRGGFRLDATAVEARLDLDDGSSYRGDHVDDLLREHTGWDVPVGALGYWVRGLLAPGEGRVRQDEDGLPAEISQFGWTITYRGFLDDKLAIPMPRRVEAVRAPYKVKLVVRNWQLAN